MSHHVWFFLPRIQTQKSALKKERVGAQGFTPCIQGGCVSPGLVCAVPVQFTGTKLDTGYFRSAVQSLAPVCPRWRVKSSRENSPNFCYTRYSPRLLEATWRTTRGKRGFSSRHVSYSSGVWFSNLLPRYLLLRGCGITDTFVHMLELELLY